MMTLDYPTGAKNAETLLIDPITGDLFIVQKRAQATAPIFRKQAPHGAGASVMEEVGLVTLANLIVGGDISPSGNGILLKTTGRIDYWPRTVGQTIPEALAGAACASLPIRSEEQGEAIAFHADGCGYVTISEGSFPAINSFDQNNCTPNATPLPTLTPTPSPTVEPACGRPFADFDDSCCTDLADFLFLLDTWQQVLNGMVVGLDDFLNLLDHWQTGDACS